jgi:7-cyano-7-deazaguanine synthase
MNKAIILSSGGVDSTTCMAIARSEGCAIYSLSFDYGQRSRVELTSCRKVAESFGAAQHLIIAIDLRSIGGSSLTSSLEVPRGRSAAEMAAKIPVTYVPARNTIFLSFALAWAEVLGAADIFTGVNAVDYSGYPDCRPEFIEAYQSMANLSTRASVEGTLRYRIRTPLIDLSKKEIILKGLELGVDYSLTHSCYDPDALGRACGSCDSCTLRLKGFSEAGVKDPIAYANEC